LIKSTFLLIFVSKKPKMFVIPIMVLPIE